MIIKMADLSVNIGGLCLKNPIIVASGPLTSKFHRIKKAADCGVAAVSLKHSMLKHPFHAKPRWYHEKGMGLIVSGDPRLDVGEAVDLICKTKAETDLRIMVNMSASPVDVNTWGELAAQFEKAGADAIEINMNCPNLNSAEAKGAALGASLGQDPDSVAAVVSNVKSSVKIPVIAKLPSEGGRMHQVAVRAEEAGADILNIHAAFRSAPGLDIYNNGAMMYPGTDKGPFGGYTGPWSRLTSNRFIADIARICKTPVMGGGGITQWEHIVESIMYGAWCVQICAAFMLEGFELCEKLLKSLEEYMDGIGYKSVADFNGLALNNIITPDKMEYSDIVAQIDQQSCSGCKKCTRFGHCEAVEFNPETKKCAVDANVCEACGFCLPVCPTASISMVSRQNL